MDQLGFLVNTDRCIACRSCVMACKEKHDLKPGRKYRKLTSINAGSWEQKGSIYVPTNVFSYALSMSCNHCAVPACLNSCPSGAIGKRADGIVFIDRDLCTGCKSCQEACPYSAPSYNAATNKMEKCDMCRELLPGGGPTCVAACSMNALEYGDLEILKLKYPEAVQQIAPMDGPEKTTPSVLIIAKRGYVPGMEVTISSMPEEMLSNEPVNN